LASKRIAGTVRSDDMHNPPKRIGNIDMIIAETKFTDQRLSVSIPKANTLKELIFIAFVGTGWLVPLIIEIANTRLPLNRSDILRIMLLLIAPLICGIGLSNKIKALRTGINFILDKSDDSVIYNGRYVGKISAIIRIEIRRMSSSSVVNWWPIIWMIFADRRDLSVLKTFNFGNIRFGTPLLGTHGCSLGEEAEAAGVALAQQLADFCERPLEIVS